MKILLSSLILVLLVPVQAAFGSPVVVVSAAAATAVALRHAHIRRFAETSGLPTDGSVNVAFALKRDLFANYSSQGNIEIQVRLCTDSGSCSNVISEFSMRSEFASGNIEFWDIASEAWALSKSTELSNDLHLIVKVVARPHWFSVPQTLMIYRGPALSDIAIAGFVIPERRLAGPNKAEGAVAKFRLSKSLQ